MAEEKTEQAENQTEEKAASQETADSQAADGAEKAAETAAEGEKKELTPEERKRLEELEWDYSLYYRKIPQSPDYYAAKLATVYAELKQFKSEMQAKYGA